MLKSNTLPSPQAIIRSKFHQPRSLRVSFSASLPEFAAEHTCSVPSTQAIAWRTCHWGRWLRGSFSAVLQNMAGEYTHTFPKPRASFGERAVSLNSSEASSPQLHKTWQQSTPFSGDETRFIGLRQPLSSIMTPCPVSTLTIPHGV